MVQGVLHEGVCQLAVIDRLTTNFNVHGDEGTAGCVDETAPLGFGCPFLRQTV
jgi:hypothetical protein